MQYAVTNTLEDQILSNVKLQITNVESSYNLQLLRAVALKDGDTIKYGETKYLYGIFTKQNCEHPFPLAKVQQKLSMKITEIDIDSQDELGSYDEEYKLDEVTIAVKDYIKNYPLANG